MSGAPVPSVVPTFVRRPPWAALVRHEVRLALREFRGTSRGRGPASTRRRAGARWALVRFGLLAIGMHVVASTVLLMPRAWRDDTVFRVASVMVVGFLFTMMVSFAMSRVVTAFHERRDLDLLLTAPIAPSLLLAVRAAAVAAGITGLFGVFLWPFADVGLVSGRWWLSRLYPLVPCLAVSATGIALVVTDGFVRLVGVRRARVGLQVFSGLVGASMYLVSQARQLLPAEWSERWTRAIVAVVGGDRPSWPVAFVRGVASGDAGAWLVLVAGSVATFVGAVALARRRFVSIAQTAEAGSGARRASRTSVGRRIARGFVRRPFVALMLKEWRLTLRAPQLISQILLQLLYLVPLLFAAFGHGHRTIWSHAALVAGLVGIASTLATSLAWLAVSGEDAPDLLAGSPVSRATMLGAKLVAAVLPPMALVVAAGLGIVSRSFLDATILWAYGALACVSAAILATAVPSPGRRSDFQRRHQGRGLSVVVEGLQFLLWAGAAGLATSGLWFAAALVTVVACAMPAWRFRGALAQAAAPA